jgi:hypothetical protein
MTQRPLRNGQVQEASLRTLSVEIKALVIGKKQMTLAVFRQLPRRPLINPELMRMSVSVQVGGEEDGVVGPAGNPLVVGQAPPPAGPPRRARPSELAHKGDRAFLDSESKRKREARVRERARREAEAAAALVGRHLGS